jgi:hypothetical protein
MVSWVGKIALAIIVTITGAFFMTVGGIGAWSASAPEPLVLIVIGVIPLAAGILMFAYVSSIQDTVFVHPQGLRNSCKTQKTPEITVRSPGF